jgi:DNA-directed RNA polymerase subunit beta
MNRNCVWQLKLTELHYTLQEIQTVKSDDVEGRPKSMSHCQGDLDFQPGLPESVNVLIRELQGLCLKLIA